MESLKIRSVPVYDCESNILKPEPVSLLKYVYRKQIERHGVSTHKQVAQTGIKTAVGRWYDVNMTINPLFSGFLLAEWCVNITAEAPQESTDFSLLQHIT